MVSVKGCRPVSSIRCPRSCGNYLSRSPSTSSLRPTPGHGVTDFRLTTRLSGGRARLNEAFSDVLAVVRRVLQSTLGDAPASCRVSDRRKGRGRHRRVWRFHSLNPRLLRRSGSLQHPLHRGRGQRRRPHQRAHRRVTPTILPSKAAWNRTSGITVHRSRRRQPRADGAGVLPRLHPPDDAGDRHLCRGPSGHHPGGHRPVRRRKQFVVRALSATPGPRSVFSKSPHKETTISDENFHHRTLRRARLRARRRRRNRQEPEGQGQSPAPSRSRPSRNPS